MQSKEALSKQPSFFSLLASTCFLRHASVMCGEMFAGQN